MTPILADDPAENDRLIQTLNDAGRVGIDTEFMREKTYYARLCLVQIATPDAVWCADPLGATELDTFWAALGGCDWVLHSGRQDIEVLYQSSGRMPRAIFDTQVAAALLGYPAQIGYANLVKELFGVALDKGHTRADWTRRPLPAGMLEYAALDVAYLLEAADTLSERLEALGRLEWVLEDSAALLDESLYRFDAGSAVERVKAARNLRGEPRRVAERLAAWREERARATDRPRQWIVKDPVLVDLAVRRPGSETELAGIPGLAASTAKRSGRELLEEIAAARGEGSDHEPPERPDEGQKAQLKRLQQSVSAVAGELGIAAEVLAPRKELTAALQGDLDGRVFGGWRREVVGERLLALLDA